MEHISSAFSLPTARATYEIMQILKMYLKLLLDQNLYAGSSYRFYAESTRKGGGGGGERGIVKRIETTLFESLFNFFLIDQGHFRNSNTQDDVVLGFPSILTV
jgi:hypothetical protein